MKAPMIRREKDKAESPALFPREKIPLIIKGLHSGLVPTPRTQRVAVAACLVALAIFSPWFGIRGLDTNLMTTVCIYGIAASGLNLMFGYTGMLSIGNAIFLGVGAYTVAITTQTWHWPILPAALLAVTLTTVVAFLLGLLLVRLPGYYFGVATLGLALAFDSLLVALPGTGGGTGFTTVPRLDLGFVTLISNLQWYELSIIVAAVMVLLLSWIVAGKRGRLLRLVRHDELAAEVLGVPVFRTKLLVFALGGLFTGVAGSLLFVSQGLVNPDSVGILISVQLVMLVVIGGPGYRMGGFVGAFTVLWLQSLLGGFGSYELLVYGAVLLVVVFYLRPGLEGTLVGLWGRVRRREPPALVATAGKGSSTHLDSSALSSLIVGREVAGSGLEIRAVRRTFGGVVAIDDVSLVVPAGQVTGLIGANGAGKSTLLNLISGVDLLEAGSLIFDGQDISHLSPAERTQRGLVRTFQVPRLVDALSVIENIVLGHEASERPIIHRDLALERARLGWARATLADLGLEQLADRPASSLGTGERKYVELARAIFSGASLMLLDEPAVGLSVEEVSQLLLWLGRMRDDGVAILVIDHNIDFIRELVDHVYSMESGAITWHGRPDEIEVSAFQIRLRSERPASSTPSDVEVRVEAVGSAAPLDRTSGGASLEVSGLSAGYGRVTVVHDVCLEVKPGEVVGLEGPNGAGKTTLLNALVGLNTRCSGQVSLDGVRLDSQSSHRRVSQGLALVPEGRQIIGSITVGANLDIALMARGRWRVDDEHRARRSAVLDLFPRLNERLDAPGSVLSGGEQQMLAIARCLMTEPRVLLLDEPSQGLSPAAVTIVVEALERLKGSVTMLIVEQNPYVLDALVDRTLTLSLGRLTSSVD